MKLWYRLHRWHPALRWPLKLFAFLLVTALVLYPKVWLLPTWVSRLADMNQTIDPNDPGLEPLAQAVRARTASTDSRELLPTVQQVVHERIPYAWDWDVWGVVDYLPTTAEVLAAGREDCDGRAVLAAAVLRRLGCEAWLVSDLKHVWVATPAGEIMGPGTGEKTMEGGEAGTRFKLSLGTVSNLVRGITFGVAVFPLTRELLILIALCGLTIGPSCSTRRAVVGCLLLVFALALLRDAQPSAGGLAQHEHLVWGGWGLAAIGWLVLAFRGAGCRSPAGRPQ